LASNSFAFDEENSSFFYGLFLKLESGGFYSFFLIKDVVLGENVS